MGYSCYMREEKGIWWTDIRYDGILVKTVRTPESQIRQPRESLLWRRNYDPDALANTLSMKLMEADYDPNKPKDNRMWPSHKLAAVVKERFGVIPKPVIIK